MTPRELFDRFQDCAMRQDGEGFAALFAADGILEFPFTARGSPLRFAGREAIRARAFEAWGRSPLRPESFATLAVTEDRAADALVAEYDVRGTVIATKAPFSVRGALVLHAKDGLIASMREYLDPIALARASAPASPREVLRLYHRAMRTKSADDLADLYAADGVHELAFHVPGRARTYAGREAVRALYREVWRDHPLELDAIEDVFVHTTEDPEVVIGQWRATGTVRATGAPFEITGLLHLRVREGLLVHVRDYMDALGVAKVLGRAPFAA
jgi:uncharacterized protein